LSFDWLRDIMLKRAADTSSVACIATSDQRRVLQMKAYLALSNDYRHAPVYCFDPWNGLTKLNMGNGHAYFQPVEQDAGEYASMAGVSGKIDDLATALKHMDRVLRERRTVLIIEYIDGPRDEEKERAVLCALRAWAHEQQVLRQGSLVVLVAGSFNRVLDDLTREYVILSRPPLPTGDERAAVIIRAAQELHVDIRNDRDALVSLTSGLNLCQVDSIVKESIQRAGRVSLDEVKRLKSTIISNTELLEMLEPSRDGFASLGGYHEVKVFVIKNIIEVMREEERARHLSLPLPRGFVLFGPPGTGKSLFARCLAGEVGMPVINFRTEPLISKWLGESGHRFNEAINMAEQMSPAILFIDEIDKLLMRRGSENGDGASGEMRRLMNQVLEWMGNEDRKAIIVGATNRPEDLDEAAIRPGRIDYMIPMLYPDPEARKQILRVHLKLSGNTIPVPLAVRGEDIEVFLDYLASVTQDFTGAELEGLVNQAKRSAFASRSTSLTPSHFTQAVEAFHIDREERETQAAYFLGLAKKLSGNSPFLTGTGVRNYSALAY